MLRRRERGAVLVLGLLFIIILINVVALMLVEVPRLQYAHQAVTRALDAAAVAGAAQADDDELLRNNPALDRVQAEATTRAYAANNLREAERYLVPTASQLASTMSVWVRNSGELDPWTGQPVVVPTVFVEAAAQVRGVASYAVVGNTPGAFSANPLAGATLRIRAKAAFRLRT